MKKILVAAAVIFCMIACKQQPADGFIINGILKGNAENAVVKLYDAMDMDMRPFDSTTVENGKFQFKGKLDRPMQVLVHIILPDTTINPGERELGGKFYLENSTVTFDADVNTLTSFYYYPPRTASPIITGSETQKEYENFLASMDEINSKLSTLYEKKEEIFHKTESEGDQAKIDGEELFDLGVRVQTELETLTQKRHEEIIKFIKDHPQSPIALDQAMYIIASEQLTVEQINNLIATLEPAWKGTDRFEMLQSESKNYTVMAVGEILPDAEFENEKGEKVLISSVLPKDDYAMVEFWASWCGPCRGEIPHLKRLRERFPNFTIVSISLDEDKDAWIKALREENMNWIQLNDKLGINGIARTQYNISGVPACFIIDKDRRIIQTDSRGTKLDKFVFETYGK